MPRFSTLKTHHDHYSAPYWAGSDAVTSLPSLPAPSVGPKYATTDANGRRTSGRSTLLGTPSAKRRRLTARTKSLISNDQVIDGPVSITGILSGQTKSPAGPSDLRAYLKTSDHDGRNALLAAVDFLLAFYEYRAAFFDLLPSEQPPRPATVLEHLSVIRFKPPDQDSAIDPSKDPPISPVVFNFSSSWSRRQRSRTPEVIAIRHDTSGNSGFTPSNVVLLDTRSARRARVPSSAYSASSGAPLLDPTSQTLRPELQLLLHNHLSGGPGSRAESLTTLLPPKLLSRAMREAELTTHPETLEPLAMHLVSLLQREVFERFYNGHAVFNLRRTTRIARMIIALVSAVVTFGVTGLMMWYPSVFSRVARLGMTPFVVAAVGYTITFRTGVCVYYGLRGIRETLPHEEPSKQSFSRRSNYAFGGEGRRSNLQDDVEIARPPTLVSVGGARTERSGTPVSRLYSLHTLSTAHFSVVVDEDDRDYCDGPGFDLDQEKGFTSSHGNPIDKQIIADDEDEDEVLEAAPVTPLQGTPRSRRWSLFPRWLRINLNTVRVEDQNIRRVQRQRCIKIGGWTVVGTIAVMAVILALP